MSVTDMQPIRHIHHTGSRKMIETRQGRIKKKICSVHAHGLGERLACGKQGKLYLCVHVIVDLERHEVSSYLTRQDGGQREFFHQQF